MTANTKLLLQSLTVGLILTVSTANAQLVVNLGNAQNDPLQQTSSGTVNNIAEASAFTTGTFSLTGTGPISFTLNTTATNGGVSGQDVGWGVSGGSDSGAIDNNGDGSVLEALNFTVSNITGLGAGQSLVFKAFGVKWGRSGGLGEYYTVNGGSEVEFLTSTAEISLANLSSLSVGAGSSGNTGFALDYLIFDVVTAGPGETAPPEVISITKSDTTVTVQFSGTDGKTYDLNKSTDLDFSVPDIKGSVTLSGTTTGTLEDTTATESAAFYRVEEQ